MKDVKNIKIGILDIQGSVEEHYRSLQKINNIEVILVKEVADLNDLQGLIIPGGESTVISKLLKRFELDKEIIEKHRQSMAIWGTCAGAILLAKSIVNDNKVEGLNLMDIKIERNGYGRQLDSFETELNFNNKKIPAVFIRAPKIMEVGEGAQVLARHENDIVAVQQGNLLATTFHPEMTDDLVVHEYFVEMCFRGKM